MQRSKLLVNALACGLAACAVDEGAPGADGGRTADDGSSVDGGSIDDQGSIGDGGDRRDAEVPLSRARWLAFADDSDLTRTVRLADTSADPISPTILHGEGARISWAPDGRRFLFLARDGLRSVEVFDDRAAEVALVGAPCGHEIYWIDARSFLCIRVVSYRTGPTTIEEYQDGFFVRLPGGARTATVAQILGGMGTSFGEETLWDVRASPDGRKLAFISGRNLQILTTGAETPTLLSADTTARGGGCGTRNGLRTCTQAIWWLDDATLYYRASLPDRILLKRATVAGDQVTVTDLTSTLLPETSTDELVVLPDAGGIAFVARPVSLPLGEGEALYWLASAGSAPSLLHRALEPSDTVIAAWPGPFSDTVAFSARLGATVGDLYLVRVGVAPSPRRVSRSLADGELVDQVSGPVGTGWLTYQVRGSSTAVSHELRALRIDADLAVLEDRAIDTISAIDRWEILLSPIGTGLVFASPGRLPNGTRTKRLSWVSVASQIAEPADLGLAGDYPLAGFRADGRMFAFEGWIDAVPRPGTPDVVLVPIEAGVLGPAVLLGQGTGERDVAWAPAPSGG